MGVDHGGEGGQVPLEFAMGMQIIVRPPPADFVRFCHIRYKKAHSVAFIIRQIRFPPRLCP